MKELYETKNLTITFISESESNEPAEKRICDALAIIITAPVPDDIKGNMNEECKIRHDLKNIGL
jgi:hypothetical protein